ncbi:hypothetical protein NLW14_004237 [Klebsiella pneumoniae]|uniref:hypothetical protein n=1 Tax=Klebsiella pneumoniae TaxID=573 RepID=UPI00215A0060|nr:hypothetical protein [Klebsiella pneumoniae]
MGTNLVDFPSNRVVEKLERLHGSSGGGGNDMLEVRVAKLESDIAHIQRDVSEIKSDIKELRSCLRNDFRLIFGAIIAVALGLAGVMAKGFGWL